MESTNKFNEAVKKAETLTEEEKQNLIGEAKLVGELREALNAVEGKLSPAGGVNNGLIYEPIAPYEYVYMINGVKGIAHATVNAKTKEWTIKIEEKEFYFDDEPLGGKEIIFNMPDYKVVTKWVKGTVKAPSSQALFNALRNYFKIFIDLSEECYYELLAYSVLQSWQIHWLHSVWYLAVMGLFSGGKTSIGEVWARVSRHGYIASNSSLAFVGRMLDRLKITPFFDEIDVIVNADDSELYALIRSSQRRGQKYSRISEGGKPQMFDTYSSMAFSVHSDLEPALKSRCFIINTQETDKINKPLIAKFSVPFSKYLYTQLFIWYLGNCEKIIKGFNSQDSMFNDFKYGDEGLGFKCDVVENKLARKVWSEFPEGMAKLIRGGNYLGRNVELLGTLSQVIQLSGLTNINYDNVQSFLNIKVEMMSENKETGVLGALRDLMIILYDKNKEEPGFRSEDGEFMVSNKDLYEQFTGYLKEAHYQSVSSRQFLGLLRELGFNRSNRRKKRVKLLNSDESKVRLTCVYDSRVQRFLGVTITSSMGSRTVLDDFTDEGVEVFDGDV